MTDHLVDDHPEHLLGERRVHADLFGDRAEAFDLLCLPRRISRGQTLGSLVGPDGLGDLEALCEDPDELIVEHIDARAVARQRLVGHARLAPRITDRIVCGGTPTASTRLMCRRPRAGHTANLGAPRCRW